jgi:hypothetical protein
MILEMYSLLNHQIITILCKLGLKIPIGEFKKTCHPRNVKFNENCDVSFQQQRTHEGLESETHEVSESRTREGLESETHEVPESRTREGLESETHEVSESRTHEDLESRTAKPRSREFVKTQNCEPAEPRSSGICEIREYDGGRVWESRYVKIS